MTKSPQVRADYDISSEMALYVFRDGDGFPYTSAVVPQALSARLRTIATSPAAVVIDSKAKRDDWVDGKSEPRVLAFFKDSADPGTFTT